MHADLFQRSIGWICKHETNIRDSPEHSDFIDTDIVGNYELDFIILNLLELIALSSSKFIAGGDLKNKTKVVYRIILDY